MTAVEWQPPQWMLDCIDHYWRTEHRGPTTGELLAWREADASCRLDREQADVPRFHRVGDLLAELMRRAITPGQQVGCGHCAWTGPTNKFAPHLLTCECANLNHQHGSGQ